MFRLVYRLIYPVVRVDVVVLVIKKQLTLIGLYEIVRKKKKKRREEKTRVKEEEEAEAEDDVNRENIIIWS